MRRRGFTLAEVLITLGVVGVISSLTVPGLISATQDRVNGPKLAATVSLLESAFHNAITTEGVEYLHQTQMFSANPACFPDGKAMDGACTEAQVKAFMGQLGKYLSVSNYRYSHSTQPYIDQGQAIYKMSSSGGKGSAYTSASTPNMPGGAYFPMFLKNGSLVHIKAYSTTYSNVTSDNISTAIGNGASLYKDPINVYIDVNGVETPNIFGRDIFGFYVGQNGSLYPVGGIDVASLEGKAGQIWNKTTDSVWVCLPESGKVGSGNGYENGNGCTARVVDNGYKIDY